MGLHRECPCEGCRIAWQICAGDLTITLTKTLDGLVAGIKGVG